MLAVRAKSKTKNATAFLKQRGHLVFIAVVYFSLGKYSPEIRIDVSEFPKKLWLMD